MPGAFEELCEQLRALPTGGTMTLSWPQFFALFKEHANEDAQKAAAAKLAEGFGSGVLFIGGYETFVRFTRKQSRDDVWGSRSQATEERANPR